MMLEDYLLTIVVASSHVTAVCALVRDFQQGILPRSIHFAAASCLLFVGAPLVLECLGMPYDNPFFVSLFQTDDVTKWGVTALAALAPWLIRLGNTDSYRTRISRLAAGDCSLKPTLRPVFYILILGVSASLAYYGYALASRGDTVWELRRHVGETLGIGIIVLYLPTHFLAFYITVADSRSRVGCIVVALLTVAAMLSVLAVGERTNLLLPFVLLCVFWFRSNIVTLSLAAAGLILCAAIVLPWFKWQHAAQDRSLDERLAMIVAGDLARAPVIAAAVEMSEPIGSRVMPYCGAGYVYSALFFVPRSWVPMKGYSSAAGLTAHIVGGRPDELGWGFGLGLVEELVLNFGWAACIPGLLLWGKALSWLDRMSIRLPGLAIPTTLAALWSSGHHLPALLLMFGVMAGVSAALHMCFVRTAAVELHSIGNTRRVASCGGTPHAGLHWHSMPQ